MAVSLFPQPAWCWLWVKQGVAMVAGMEAEHGIVPRKDWAVMHSSRMDMFWAGSASCLWGLSQYQSLGAHCGLIHQHRISPTHCIRLGDLLQGPQGPE